VSATASEQRVRSAGVELAVTSRGDPSRPAVVLVHGYPDTRDVWCDVAPALAERFHVIAYDVRGAGRSTAPDDLAGFDLERLCDDVIAVIDAVCPGRPVHLAGHDWGSIQGWEFVTSPRLRERFASFTSISGPCLDHVGVWLAEGLRSPSPRRLAALAGQGLRSWYIPVLSTPGISRLARSGLYRRNVLRRLRHPRTDAVAGIPVQIVVPLRDRFVSPRLFDDVERWAPSLRRRTIDCGHWVPRTRPRELAGWIAEHVDGVEAGRTW
jgi:pimeloyl-ACP methyl ester carboxylesterase